MADGVVIKIDGDDSGFREKMRLSGDAAAQALAGVTAAAGEADAAVGLLGERLAALIEPLSAVREALGTTETSDILPGARDMLYGVYDAVDLSGKSREKEGGAASGGVKEAGGDAKSSAGAMASGAAAELDAAAQRAREAGANVGQGFADGMSGKLGVVVARAAALAFAAISAINAAAQNASPSKAAKKSGAFVGEGFAIGIAESVASTRSVSREIGRAGLAGLEEGSARMAGYGAMGRDAAYDIDYDRLADAVAGRPVQLNINGKSFARAVAADAASAIDGRKNAVYAGRGR